MTFKDDDINLHIDNDIYDTLLDYAKKFKEISLCLDFHFSYALLKNFYCYWFSISSEKFCTSNASIYSSPPFTNSKEFIKRLKKEYVGLLKAYKQTKKDK